MCYPNPGERHGHFCDCGCGGHPAFGMRPRLGRFRYSKTEELKNLEEYAQGLTSELEAINSRLQELKKE